MSHKLHIPTNFDAHIPDLVMAFTVVAITAIVFTLGGYAWAAWNPVSRPHLNRVSFRLLVYALVANLLYAVSMIAGTRLGAGAACNFNTFASNVVLMFAGVMFASMAINLQFWEANATCWFNSPNPAVQLRWSLDHRHSGCSSCRRAKSYHFSRLWGIWPPDHPKTTYVLYRTIILRIGLYPLISCFFTITGCILDLHQVQDPEDDRIELEMVHRRYVGLRPPTDGVLPARSDDFVLHLLFSTSYS
ncbi:hypothetical protein FB451DRAFT_1490359 [Mycena latifolia]|nr:hypothetical protein FB451DRAFT_1490359 [Mycena latifolia]